MVVTRGAVAVRGRDDDRTWRGAPACGGWSRAAQTEHPDRFVLVDLDGDDAA